jgi:hypothetical protein
MDLKGRCWAVGLPDPYELRNLHPSSMDIATPLPVLDSVILRETILSATAWKQGKQRNEAGENSGPLVVMVDGDQEEQISSLL